MPKVEEDKAFVAGFEAGVDKGFELAEAVFDRWLAGMAGWRYGECLAEFNQMKAEALAEQRAKLEV